MPYYVVINDPVGAQPSSLANNLWTNQDIALPGDASGDGSVDNAQVPIRMILRPGNPGTHVVGVSNFTIGATGLVGGQNYSSVIQGMPYPGWNGPMIEMYEWVSGAASADGNTAAISLPTEVTRVLMYNWNESLDSQPQDNNGVFENYVGNEVVVLAFIDPNYSVPNVDTVIKLDIDGDAQAIPGGVENVVYGEGVFDITLQLNQSVESANAYIQCQLPDGINDDDNLNYTFEIIQDGGNTGKIRCTRKSVYQGNNIGNFSSCNFVGRFFKIIPNNGFVVSRHMFWFSSLTPTSIGSTSNPAQSGGYVYYADSVEWNGQMYPWTEPYIIDSESDGFDAIDYQISCATNGSVVNLASLAACEQGEYNDGYSSNVTSTPLADFYTDVKVVQEVPFPAYASQAEQNASAAGTTVIGSWAGSLCSGIYNNNFGQIRAKGIWLTDEGGVEFPYNEPGWPWVEVTGDTTTVPSETYNGAQVYNAATIQRGVMPDFYCPSDFEGNEVLVSLHGLINMNPTDSDPNVNGFQPAHINIKLYGEAQVVDDSECGEFSVDIFDEED
tara:strand:- start:2037 stop:3701 length:1665 start_codon:yes stop_codon:yes gene_type:complete